MWCWNAQSPPECVLWGGWIAVLVTKCVNMDNACRCAPQLVVWHRGQSYMLTIAVRLLRCFCKSIQTSWLLKWWHKHIEHLVCFEKVAKRQLTPDGTQTQQFVDTIVLWDQMKSYICSAIDSTNIIMWLYESICIFFLIVTKCPEDAKIHAMHRILISHFILSALSLFLIDKILV